MIKSRAAVLETDAVIFPMKFGKDKQEKVTFEEPGAKLAAEKQPIKTDIEVRFTRLRKSLRKRSASIL